MLFTENLSQELEPLPKIASMHTWLILPGFGITVHTVGIEFGCLSK